MCAQTVVPLHRQNKDTVRHPKTKDYKRTLREKVKKKVKR